MQDKTIIDRIMLRFRPIAPKPVTGDSASSELLVGYKNPTVTCRRKKRKYVRVSKNCRNSGKKISKRISAQGTADGPTNRVMTLPLMPEKADPDGTTGVCSVPRDQEPPTNLSLEINIPLTGDQLAVTRVPDRTVVESWVTVETVPDTCIYDGALGRTDVEKMKNLERDTCPGFISDGSNRVVWVNEAYKRMVTGTQQDGGGHPPDTVVWLVMKERLPYPQYAYRSFSCHVRVQYTWQKDKYTKIVPCDVWRMDCGGYAWRLDVKAALSLGI